MNREILSDSISSFIVHGPNINNIRYAKTHQLFFLSKEMHGIYNNYLLALFFFNKILLSFCLKNLARSSQTQQCTPRRPEYTHSNWRKPKSSSKFKKPQTHTHTYKNKITSLAKATRNKKKFVFFFFFLRFFLPLQKTSQIFSINQSTNNEQQHKNTKKKKTSQRSIENFNGATHQRPTLATNSLILTTPTLFFECV